MRDILDLSQIEAGVIRPDRQDYPFSALVDDVLGRLRPLLRDRSMEIDVPDDLPPVYIDDVAIDRVVSNLIESD